MYFYLSLLFALVAMSHAASRSCYNFPGDSFLQFTASSLQISDRVHYSLKFRTGETSGILLYSEGGEDYEGLFVYNGRLVYLLTNPSPSGVEGSVGTFHQGQVDVNDRSWYKVELWRNWDVNRQPPLQGLEKRTGFVLYDNNGNKLEEQVDNLPHDGVRMVPPRIHIGGLSPSVVHVQGDNVPPFTGQIKDIKEERNDLDFTSWNVNGGEKVQRC